MSAILPDISLGLSSSRLMDILHGRRGVLPETGLRLGRSFGIGPRLWLNLQTAYGLAVVERQFGGTVTSGFRLNAA
jgi:antitoxin HigA-1